MSSQSRTLAALLVICNIIFGNGAPPQKIVKGKIAVANEFPYIVALIKDDEHYCGGAIISEQHILTAAHCVDEIMIYPYSNIVVLTGTNNLRLGGENHTISDVTVHPFFVRNGERSYPNDIAIVKLSAPIIFNEHQHNIRLPCSDVRDGSYGAIAGWGLRANGLPIHAFLLMKITTEILEPNKCRQYIENQLYYEQLCGVNFSEQGTCDGDSGGPLAMNGVLIGILSWGKSICGSEQPDIYTNVYAYGNFIRQNMT